MLLTLFASTNFASKGIQNCFQSWYQCLVQALSGIQNCMGILYLLDWHCALVALVDDHGRTWSHNLYICTERHTSLYYLYEGAYLGCPPHWTKLELELQQSEYMLVNNGTYYVLTVTVGFFKIGIVGCRLAAALEPLPIYFESYQLSIGIMLLSWNKYRSGSYGWPMVDVRLVGHYLLTHFIQGYSGLYASTTTVTSEIELSVVYLEHSKFSQFSIHL